MSTLAQFGRVSSVHGNKHAYLIELDIRGSRAPGE